MNHGSENSIARSDFYAVVEADRCTSCENCIDRCAFDAMAIMDGICEVDIKACYGCGLCISSCETEALSLVQKSSRELSPPPVDGEAWRKERAISRSHQAL